MLQNLTCSLHIVIVTWKCTDVFRVFCFGMGGRTEVGGGYTGGSFHGEIFHREETFSEGCVRILCYYLKKTTKK